MREPIYRRRVSVVVLASGFAAACNSQPPAMQTGLPAPCTAAPLADYVAFPDLLSSAKGSVTGSDLVARLCDGGASAAMQRTSATTSPPNKLVVDIGSDTSDPKRDYQIALPTDATRLQLSAIIGPDAPQPGTYTERNTCGEIILCAIMPVPTSVNCPTTLQSDVCPPGCTFGGGTPTCVPVEPTICYEANTAPGCLGSVLDVKGSWHLTLSSVEPYRAPDGGIPGYELFVTHGSLDATLVKIDTGAVGDAGVGASTVSLSLSF